MAKVGLGGHRAPRAAHGAASVGRVRERGSHVITMNTQGRVASWADSAHAFRAPHRAGAGRVPPRAAERPEPCQGCRAPLSTAISRAIGTVSPCCQHGGPREQEPYQRVRRECTPARWPAPSQARACHTTHESLQKPHTLF